MSEITPKTLKFHDRTADVTYCADITFFLHATSGGLSLTVAFFFLRRFLAFCRFKCYLGSFSSRWNTAFSPNIIPPKYAEQYQIAAKWLEKSLFSDVRVEE